MSSRLEPSVPCWEAQPGKHVLPMILWANLPDGHKLLGLPGKILSADAKETILYGTQKLCVC